MPGNGRNRTSAGGSGNRTSVLYRSQTFTQERFALNFTIPNLKQLSQTFKNCDLLDKSLKAFCVSPLNNFDYSELGLKSYSRKLEQHLTNLHPSSTSAHFRVEFEVKEGLAQTHHDNSAVKITVQYQVKGRKRIFYEGLLLSWNCRWPAPYAGYVHLPLVLCSGTESARDLVHAMLAKCFDCVISSLSIDHKDLICLYVAMANRSRPAQRSQWLQLQYQLPGPPSGDEVVLSVPIKEQKEFWHSIVNADQTSIDMGEVETCYKSMMTHVVRTYGINIGSLRLFKVKLPTVTISADGKLKARTPVAMVVILNLLSDLSTRLDSAHAAVSQLEPS